MGTVGLAIDMRASYPHGDISRPRRGRVVNNSCSKCTSTRYDSMPRWWYGTPIEASVHLDPFAHSCCYHDDTHIMTRKDLNPRPCYTHVKSLTIILIFLYVCCLLAGLATTQVSSRTLLQRVGKVRMLD